MSKFVSVLLCMAAGLLLCCSLGVNGADKPTTKPAKAGKPPKKVVEDAPHPAPISQYMIWNGEDFKGGHSWVTKGNKFTTTSEVSHSGKTALEFDGDGQGFIGGGFNFFGWYPPDSGVDITNYDNLSMWIKMDCPPQMGPGTFSIGLNCSGTKTPSRLVPVKNYCPNLEDGNWHEIVIPLKHLLTHDFDATSAWELEVSTWQGDQRGFQIYIDDVSVDIRPKQ